MVFRGGDRGEEWGLRGCDRGTREVAMVGGVAGGDSGWRPRGGMGAAWLRPRERRGGDGDEALFAYKMEEPPEKNTSRVKMLLEKHCILLC